MTAVVALAVAPASARVLQKLDKKPASPGHIAMRNGTTLVAWSHQGGSKADYAEFCRIPKGGECKNPVKLPNPAGTGAAEGIAGAFPLLLGGKNVAVVAPRYVRNDLVVWSSSDGGKTFDSGDLLPGYSNKTNPSDVIYLSPVVAISADNVGLGFSESIGFAGGGFTFTSVTGTVEGSSMASVAGGLLESYWTLGSKSKVHYESWEPSGSNPLDESQWSGPRDVANGYGGELTSGSGGTFIATQEYTGKRKEPTAARVRQLGTSGFGSPVTLFNDKDTDLFALGDIAEAPNGHVAVVWPGYKKNGALVMRAFTSKNGKNFGTADLVAGLGKGYGIDANAQLAYASDGSGEFTFINGSGLHLANLKPGK
jgi:hypothetical protein